ncbi:major histocompatibility complex class I-related gene protein-like [Pholidichthys leucotaenia]
MKRSLFVLFLCFQGMNAVKHSLQCFHTASSGVPGFPEFVAVAMIDGQQIEYYDSEIKKTIPKQDWMEKNEGPEFWEDQTQRALGHQQTSIADIDILKQRFNQTGGIHLFQYMYGCEWDDETDVKNGYRQHGYDGEDFLVLDLKTESWIAATPRAVITKLEWDKDKAFMSSLKFYFNQECFAFLKEFVNYGRDSLMRKVLPSVSLLQKSSSSPVTCHATGFYSDEAELMWRKVLQALQRHGAKLKPEKFIQGRKILIRTDSTAMVSYINQQDEQGFPSPCEGASSARVALSLPGPLATDALSMPDLH